MKLLKQILFVAMCWLLLVVGTSANAAPDHSWKGIAADACPTGTTPPYCLTDLDSTFNSYGYTRRGNELDTYISGGSPLLKFDALTRNPDVMGGNVSDELVLLCNKFQSTILTDITRAAVTYDTQTGTSAGHVDIPQTTAQAACSEPILTPLFSTAGSTVTQLPPSISIKLIRKLHFKNNLDATALEPVPLANSKVTLASSKIVVMIHGWNPSSFFDKYQDGYTGPLCVGCGDEWGRLTQALKGAMQDSDWQLYRYHWEADADTGNLVTDSNGVLDTHFVVHGTRAAEIGHQHGQHLGELLASLPNLENVHFIAHSAGSWVARAAIKYLVSKNPALKFQITLLDPFIPATAGANSSLDLPAMRQLEGPVNGNGGMYLLENYWAYDITLGTNNPDIWTGIYNINKNVGYGIFPPRYPGWYAHGWPIAFYEDSVSSSIEPGTRSKCPNGLGWKCSLFYNEPQILRPPKNQEVPLNGTATFTVQGNIRGERFPTPDNAGLKFYWQRCYGNIAAHSCYDMGDTNALGGQLPTGPTISVGPVTAADNGNMYQVIAKNSAGEVTSNIVTLTVQSAATAPTITTQPQSQTATPGAPTIQFDVVATGTNPTYQWRKDGAPISGETNSSLFLNNITAADAGSYTVVVTNTLGSATSTPATLTVSAAAAAPAITLVTPAALPGLALTQRQLITLDGTGFTANSRLTFTVGATTYANRVPVFANNQLQYNIAVGNPAQTQNWTVKVVNGAQASTAAPFTVTHSADTTLPQLKITGVERTAPGIVHLSGTATDDVGVTGVIWSTDKGASGTASYSFGRWNIPGMTLAQGANVITVSAADAAGHVGTDTVTLSPAAPGANLSTMQIAAGYGHIVALKSDGTVVAWGMNSYGQIGDGTTTRSLLPQQIGTGYSAIAVGYGHTVALKTDGSLWAWGYNGYGQLGDGTTTRSLLPKQIGTGYSAIAVGWMHTVALKSDGGLWAWGKNEFGQLGDGTTTDSPSPKQIGAGYSAIVANYGHTVALKTDGSLWAWGYNGYGQLGDGTTTNSLVPKQIGTDYSAIAAGNGHTVALKTDGSLWAWGDNSAGQLGDGTTTNSLVPKQIGTGYSAIAVGWMHTVALKSDGGLWAWGKNEFGQLGDGTTTNSLVPKQIGTGYSAIAAGNGHTVALKTDGSLWTWGYNIFGQLGDGTTVNKLAPVQTLGVGGTGFLNLATSAPFFGTPAVALSATSLIFTAQDVGSSSAAQTLTLTNSGTGPLSLNNIAAGGDFAVTHNCPASLAAGASCAINVSFTPLLAGARDGLLTLWSDAPDSPQMVSLTGTGTGTAVATLAVTPSRLNDTGITASQCYEAGSDVLVACNSAGALALNNAQDGMAGRDANAATNSNTDGKLGFSFASVTGGCVQDNVTGLMWEVKTTDGGLRDWTKTYTNFSATYNLYGLYSTTTDASGFVTAVNATNLCGYSDWRLPTADELQSIVDYGVAYPGPTVDATWFPNTKNDRFWSASPISIAGLASSLAGVVNFSDGHVNDLSYYLFSSNRYNSYYVRLVRAGQSPTQPRYIVSADGQEVTDSQTSLIWRRCAEGMNWNGSTCAGVASTFIHGAALQRAAAQAASSGIAWRLPNIKELASIADKGRSSPAIDPTAFPATPATLVNWFWSASAAAIDGSPYAPGCGYLSLTCAWYVDFNSGNVNGDIRYGSGYVRLVRDGSSPPPDGTTHFSNQAVGSTSAAQTVTFTNSGTVALGIGSIAASGDFLATHNCPASLVPGANCSITVQFAPTAPGNRTGILTVTSPNGATWGGALLNGTGMSPVLVLSSSALNFAPQTLNTASATQPIALTNTGNAALNISSIAASGDYTVTHNCGSLAAGANCAMSITFTATAVGARNGTVTITSDATGSPYSVTLSGTGVTIPDVPTGATATAGNTQATVIFTAPANNGGSAITGYTVISIPAGGVDSNANSTSLSHVITGLANGTAYTFTVIATNSVGASAASAASNSVTPVAPVVTFTVSASAGANGSISPASQTVAQSNTTSFTVTPNTGYMASASGCGGSLNGSTYTTATITADCTVSATFTNIIQISLATGWNLVGNSVNTPLDVAATLGDATKVTTVWKWIPLTSKWAFYAPSMTAPNLATYATSKGYDVLTTVNGGEGFWVNAKAAFTAQLPAGTAIGTSNFADQTTPPNKLPMGWSLIAVGDNPSPRNFANAIAISQPVSPAVAATSVTTLWAWDSGLSGWYFYAPSLDNSGGLANYITTKGYLDFAAKGKMLDPTTGFWVNHP